MKNSAVLCLMAALLTACGVAGEPRKPSVAGSTSIGMNSKSGLVSDTSISVMVPLS